MKKQPIEMKNAGSDNHEALITVQASKVTNGTGGGAIIEGSYTVWHCDSGQTGVPICVPIF